jgi:ribosome biogenesis GTPase A
MFLLLQEGIVIIDTPGIGTSKEMTERIQQYLANAFGCINIERMFGSSFICDRPFFI